MSLVSALAKVPVIEGKSRRGMLIALEGPAGGGIADKFAKIEPELGEYVVYTSDQCTVPDWSNPESALRLQVSRLAELQVEILNHLKEGKTVVCDGFLLGTLSTAYLHNCFGVHNINDGTAFRTLYTQLRGLVIPDISFLYVPPVRVYVEKLITSGKIADENAFLYSQQARELKSLNFASEFLQDTASLSADSLRIEYDMLNYIVTKSVTHCYEPIKFCSF